MATDGSIQARAVTDGEDHLISADEPLASLQLHCGGDLPGLVAVPGLLELVRKSRQFDLKLARTVSAQDGRSAIVAWVEIEPRSDGEAGCNLTVRNWHSAPLAADDTRESDQRRAEIDRHVAEFAARLDVAQCLLSSEGEAPDLAELVRATQSGIGRPWTDFVMIEGSSHRQPIHWRLLDGAAVSIPGSQRRWRARLFPRQSSHAEVDGFELCLTAETALVRPSQRANAGTTRQKAAASVQRAHVARDIAPVLRQPIARIIANAETIRTRLAGPLPEEYGTYAADIAAAGQHLLALLDDLADLEVVEAADFSTAPDHIDLGDVARRAAGILGVRALECGISIDPPKLGESLPAIAEFRRVLQILLNLIGNALRYGPRGSQVWVRLEELGDRGRIIVADQGPGLSEGEQSRVFEKFERLGRSGDGGSGLGLYISRRLARAMGGELSVESAPGQGARFILDVPRDGVDTASGS